MSNEAAVGDSVVRLLLLEDRQADAELMIANLTAGGVICHCTRVQTEGEFRRALDEPVDAVLADYHLPQFSGMDALKIVRERLPDLPFIIVSGTIGEDQAAAVIKCGADDYLLKDRLGRLATALVHALRERRLRSEAARAQAEAAAQKRLLQSVVDSLADGLLVADARGSLILVNPTARRMMGDALAMQRPGDWTSEHGLIDPRTGRPLEEADLPLLRAVRGVSTDAVEILVVRPGHETRVVSSSGRPLVDSAGKADGGVSTWRDITAERTAQAALRQSEARYRGLFWNDLVGHYVSSPEGQLLACNPAFAKMFGFESVEQALQADLSNLYRGEVTRRAFLDQVRQSKTLEHVEWELVTHDGRVIHTVENTIGVFNESGDLIQIQGSINDDSQRREAEQQLRQSQKMEAVGQLAAGVAHDFNNLLTVMLGYAEQLIDDAPSPFPDRCRSHLNEIIAAARRGTRLTHQLLAFGRRQIWRSERLDLNDVIVGLEPMLQRLVGERVTLSSQLAADLPSVHGSAGALEQVITNLIVNARDAMPGGGTIRIETRRVTPFPDQVVADAPGSALGAVVLTVADEGVGMDPATAARIFEPFFTTKAPGQGTGLGLSVVYGIVKECGGSISVATTVGAGTQFHIRLPGLPVNGHPPEQVLPRRAATQLKGHERVLVAEDDAGIRLLVRLVLERHGYQILEAANGAEAIELLEHGPVDLVITDVVMPRLGGVGLAQSLALRYPDTKLLYMSGYPAGSERMTSSGVHYLGKPFAPGDLLRAVREVLDATTG